jgi:hypothetical protein
MTLYYLDSSVWVKSYLTEAGNHLNALLSSHAPARMSGARQAAEAFRRSVCGYAALGISRDFHSSYQFLGFYISRYKGLGNQCCFN